MILQNMIILLTLNLVLMFPLLKHPLSMGLNLLMTTLFLSIFLGMSMSHTWLSYCLVLILLGGLLVIFIYIALLSPNEVFSKKTNPSILFLLTNMVMISFLSMNNNTHPINSLNNDMKFTPMNNELSWLNPFYSQEMGLVTLFLVFYLLLTLLVVVFNTKTHALSLRSTTK